MAVGFYPYKAGLTAARCIAAAEGLLSLHYEC
jgi:hypothetical protein